MPNPLDIRDAIVALRDRVEECRRASTSQMADAERQALRRAALRAAADELPTLLFSLNAPRQSSGIRRAREALTIAGALAIGARDRQCATALLRALLDVGDRLADAADALLPPTVP